jgi:dihydrofolate synthase/folylpolyglutamate synthase
MSTASLIESLSGDFPKGYDLSLDRIRRLLAALGDPQDRIPPVFHVAGTNGKGSVCAFLRAILEAAGKSVHVHTSPHLVEWRERYRIGAPQGGGQLVDDAVLEDALFRAANANAGEKVTVFELLTAAGFLLFAEHPADFCILEVGLGGRLDATNVIAAPLACVIASISLDHQMHLGDTVEKIAMEKAGIVKKGVPVILSAQQFDTVPDLVRRHAQRMHVPSFLAGEDFHAVAQGGRLVYQDEAGLLDLPLPALSGSHQIDNAAAAIAAIRHSGLRIADEAFETGMRTVRWPGRLERLRAGNLTALAGEEAEIWIDGGHNPAAGEVIAQGLAELEERSPRPLTLICGMLTTKEPRGFLAAFAGLARRVLTVPVEDSDSGFDPRELAGIARDCGLEAQACASLDEAVRLAAVQNETGPGGQAGARILICGSLYLVGQALRENGTAPQ